MPAPRLRPARVAGLLALAAPLCGFTFVADSPENQGMSSTALAALQSWSDPIAANTGLLVLRNDRVLLEHYTGTATASTRFGLTSATKSFGAGLLLRAIDQGLVTLDDPLCGVPGLTLFRAASMAGGFKKGSNDVCGSTPQFAPGADFLYSDGSANVVRDRLREVYGQDLEPQLEALFDAIGITQWRWEDRQRFSSGMSVSLRDFTRYGRLWARGGDWDGVQVLPADGFAAASTPADPALKEDYGLLWWVMHDQTPPFYDRYGFELNPMFPDSAPDDAMLALGCNRALLLVVPSLQLVVARAGGDCISIADGTPTLSDQARSFVTLALAGVSACSDGIDNDGNLLADFPDDPGCDSLADTEEQSGAPQVPALPPAAFGLLAFCLLAAAALPAPRRRLQRASAPGGAHRKPQRLC